MSVDDALSRARELFSRARRGLEAGDAREVCENAFRLATLVLQEGPRLALALGKGLDIEADLLSQSILLRTEQIRESGLDAQECFEVAEMSLRLLERITGVSVERER